MGASIPKWNVTGSTISSNRKKNTWQNLTSNTFFFLGLGMSFYLLVIFSFYIPKTLEQNLYLPLGSLAFYRCL